LNLLFVGTLEACATQLEEIDQSLLYKIIIIIVFLSFQIPAVLKQEHNFNLNKSVLAMRN
jgi:hypothetical protein